MISEIRAVLKKLSHLLPLAISQIANYTSISSHSSLRPLINQWMGGEWGFLFVYVSLLFSYSSPLIVGPESFVSQPYSTIASIYKRLEWESLLKSHTLFSCIDTLLITQAKTKLIYHQLFLVNVCWLQVMEWEVRKESSRSSNPQLWFYNSGPHRRREAQREDLHVAWRRQDVAERTWVLELGQLVFKS